MPVLLAAFFIVMVGMTGLAVDYGFATLERRLLQNAADAAAVTGARRLAVDATPATTVKPAVDAIAIRNRAGLTGAGITCTFVDGVATDLGTCTAAPPGAADGVRVVATTTRDTFFMVLLGIPRITVSAQAVARITALTVPSNPLDRYSSPTSAPYDAGNALFIVCGYDTKVSDGSTYSILNGSRPGGAPWDVRSGAFGKWYVIHDPHVSDCGMQSSKFKGLNGTAGTVTLPATLDIENGTKAGPTRSAVNGPDGCGSNLSSDSVDGCVMILPIAVSSPAKERLYSVRWLPFEIKQIDANTHWGRLLSTYNLNDPHLPWTYLGGNTWDITTVRLAR